MDKKIVIDVGSAKGEFARHVLMSHSNTTIFAVEPNISAHGVHLDVIRSEHSDRFLLHPYALAEESGTRPMYGLSQLKGQIGSLKKFNSSKVWDKYIEAKIDKSKLINEVYVDVKSVKDFLSDIDNLEIDFLKIDVQGYDVIILREFLKFSSVKCMVVEINTVSDPLENIYDSENNLTTLSKIISQFDLKIIKIVPNWDLSELNVFLAYNEIEGREIIQLLKISENPVFIKGWKVSVQSELFDLNAHKLIKTLFKFFIHPFKYSKKIKILLLKNLQ